MGLFNAVSVSLLVLGKAVASLETRQQPTINATAEYSTICKSCPYNLCTNVNIPYGGDVLTLTCWTEGDLIDDTDLWLKTTDNCYVPEYDLDQYEGDFREELEYCGDVPLEITEQDAEVRYLSECKWEYSTSSESLLYYGRDLDTTLTCWAEGEPVLENPYWYKTLDNCHISGSGLWEVPDHSTLDNCGPEPFPRANETLRRRSAEPSEESSSLARRWLQPEIIGEEYAPCYSCPSATVNGSCEVERVYEFNDTVVSQCLTNEYVTYPNGTVASFRWLLTTDWCYVESYFFWVPPWDNYRFPRCEYWDGY